MAVMLALIPFVIFAQQAPVTEHQSWVITLSNYGVAGVMLGFFIWWTKRSEDRRDVEREKTNKIQEENTKALNLMTRGMMVQVMAMNEVSETVKDLAAKIKEQADADIAAALPK